jgi:uncharacterized protein
MSFKRVLLLVLAVPLLLLIYSYWEATSTPRVRQANIELRDWPAGAEPITVVLISDIHVAGPDMPPGRLRRIVGQINGLDPDLVLIAGDLVSDKRFATRYYSLEDAMAPLAALKPQLGTFAVLGNHDHWRNANAARRALKAADVRLIENSAMAAGPLAIGGLDDDFTGRADVDRMAARLRRLQGARLVLSHSPDPFAALPPDMGFMLAGHTHCGQIAPPLIGPISTMSRYGKRYACGRVEEAGKILIVSAGLGTSVLPLRLGAPPDLWLLELGPKIPPA